MLARPTGMHEAVASAATHLWPLGGAGLRASQRLVQTSTPAARNWPVVAAVIDRSHAAQFDSQVSA